MNPVTAAPETVSTSGSRTLVLNAGYEPLSVVSFRRALVLVMNGRAIMVEGDDAHPVRSVEGTWERPSVIVLTRYVKMPHNRHIPVSRRGVLRRDSHRCAYCGNSATTIDTSCPDHAEAWTPGRTSWRVVSSATTSREIEPLKKWAGGCSASPKPRMAARGWCAVLSALNHTGKAISPQPKRV